MKRIIPMLLVLLLLCGCAAAPQPAELPEQTNGPEQTNQPEQTNGPEQTNEPELPEKPETDAETPAPEKEETVMRADAMTLDGTDSYLRLTLPEGWGWTEGETEENRKSLLLCPPTDDGFQIEVSCWDDFGMCGTGVDFQELQLPNGMKATLATEISDETVWWTLILPASPDQFTLQITAPQALIDAHQAEIDAILSGLQIGALAHIPPQPTAPLVDR